MSNEAVCRTAPATPGLLNKLCQSDEELSKSQRTSKSHQWFKSYEHFTEVVDFAYWWSCIGEGVACSQGPRKVKLSSNQILIVCQSE